MMENIGKKAIILYELALAIGGDLDLEAMVYKALAAFVRQLGCSSGAVFLASHDILPDEPAVAISDCGGAWLSLLRPGNAVS